MSGQHHATVRIYVLVALVALSATARPAVADEVAILVVDAPAGPNARDEPQTVTLLNRRLPSGTPVKLQVPVPGTDPATGTLIVWPQVDGARCGHDPGELAKQRYMVGLVTSGSGDTRMLEGTLPPLQLATRYCIKVIFDRRLPSEVSNAVAEVVANTPIVWRDECAKPNREDNIAAKIETSLGRQLAIYPKVKILPGRVKQAATTIVRLFDVEKHCDKIAAATKKVELRAAEQKEAGERLKKLKFERFCVTPPPSIAGYTCEKKPVTTVAAWPAAALQSPPVSLAIAVKTLDVGALGAALALVDPALGQQLQGLASLTSKAHDKQAKQLASMFSRKPAPRDLELYLPSDKRYVVMSRLHDADPNVAGRAFSALLASVESNGDLLTAQLQVMRSSDAATADAWIQLLAQLADADRALASATAAVKEADAVVDALADTVQDDLKATMQTDTVKDILLTTASEPVVTSSAKAPTTDEKASWISPTVGVLVAAPIIRRDGDTGFIEGWIQPYVGASIYFARVDRVIDLDDLVGDVYWQRNSFTVGVLPNKPNVHGKDISGPWNAAVVPYVGFGHRFTQYVRGDLGVIPFKYADANPTVSDTDWGVALWLGVSLDADVWALVAGKVK